MDSFEHSFDIQMSPAAVSWVCDSWHNKWRKNNNMFQYTETLKTATKQR